MRILNRTLVVGLALILISASTFGVAAQAVPPTVRITQANLPESGEPLVTVDLSLVDQKDASGGFRGGLTAADFEVFEDDKQIPSGDITPPTEETAGLAVVIVLDTGKYITKNPGVIDPKRLTRWNDLRDVSDDPTKDGLINELLSKLTDPKDLFGMVGVGQEVIEPAAPLAHDTNSVWNVVNTDPLMPYANTTPLRAGITRALKLFEPPEAPVDLPPNVQKLIVVFSDGIDVIKNEEIYSDLIRLALDAHIAYYTIGMKSPGSNTGYESLGLKRIADATGGVFSEHGSPDQHQAVLDLFTRLATQRQQYRLIYKTHAAQGPHKLRIVVNTVDGKVEATTYFISKIQMPTLKIEATPLDLEKGGTVVITSTWQKVDEYDRPPSKMEYLVDGKIISTVTALAPFVWETSTQPDEAHEYALEVRAYDSILLGAPPAISNQIKVKMSIPATTQVAKSVGQNWLGLLLLPVVILLLIIVIPNRKKITQTAKATTMRLQQTLTRRLPSASAAKYKLMALSLGQEYPLTERIMRVGRDPNSNIYLADLSISTVHADLTEDQSGTYMVADLASTNGTFVNGVLLQRGPVPGQPGPAMLLRPGDMLRLGSVELRFDYAKVTRRLPPGS
jgi:hypothetical protein